MNIKRLVRFMRSVKIGKCWTWKGHKQKDGYGVYGKFLAHRIAHELFIGPIPVGLEIDHTCRVRSCVNPAHLEAVTHLENIRRGQRAMQTHCLKGHRLTGNNVYFRRDRPGSRVCKKCRNDEQKKNREKRKEYMRNYMREWARRKRAKA